MSKLAALSMAAFVLAACHDNPVAVEPETEPQFDVAPRSTESQPIPGQYIVVFRDQVQDAPGLARRLAVAHGGTLRFTYQHTIKGFSVRLPDRAAAALARNPNVAYVEQDQVASAITTQSGATWGIDRIDQQFRPLSGTYTYSSTGSGVTAYIIDTGIDIGHNEFGNRAHHGVDYIDNDAIADDCNGHGTHVAGTVGGTMYGVAKSVTLVAVRVLDCEGSGTWSGVIAGMDWATANHQAGNAAVANMSLGGGKSTAVNDATQRMITDGVATVVAAGNESKDACTVSPASTPDAMTIGATNKLDERPYWSNVGSCVDWFAPGAGITSAWIGSGATETNTISGTSMASPHTAGVAALYLQSNPSASPGAVRTALYNLTTKGIVKKSRSVNNHLLFTNY